MWLIFVRAQTYQVQEDVNMEPFLEEEKASMGFPDDSPSVLSYLYSCHL